MSMHYICLIFLQLLTFVLSTREVVSINVSILVIRNLNASATKDLYEETILRNACVSSDLNDLLPVMIIEIA